MNTSAPIVVGTDGSSTADFAIRWAAEEAAMHGCPLRVVLVLEPVDQFLPGLDYYPLVDSTFEREVKRMLAAGGAVARSVVGGRVDVTTELLHGPVLPTLAIESKSARMLVVGSRGRGAFSRAILGSVSSALVRHAYCPVAVIHEETRTLAANQKYVLVGVDGTPNSVPAIGVAMKEASIRKVPLKALYAWREVSGAIVHRVDWKAVVTRQRVTLAESMAGWQEQFPDVTVERLIVQDSPVRNLLERTQDAQLIVVGSRGRGGFTGLLLGSTSQALVQASMCPVIVVRKD